ncbi:transmembrane protein C1orf162 homolog [Pelecanus crispus]|uniref:transmembrane protein C1orf162 homolog n=1 Tax=Pelecanus crispus TaxID=36300 RepID=UPI003F5D2E4C
MGGGSSKSKTVPVTTAQPTSTTVTVHTTTVHTTTVYTSATNLKAPEVKCWIDNHEMLYLLLAFISGILSTVLVFAVVYLFIRKCKRSHQNLQEQVPSQTVSEESAKNTENEVAYTSVVFQRSRTPVGV